MDFSAANLLGLGFCIGLLVMGSIFLAFVEPWMQWLTRVERQARLPETLADELNAPTRKERP